MKPGTLPTFMNDTTRVDATKSVAPTAARSTDGWAAGERPSAQVLNYLFGWISEWLDWVNAVDLGTEALANLTLTAADMKHGSRTYNVGPGGGIQKASGTIANDFNLAGDAIVDNAFYWSSSTTAAQMIFNIETKVGDRLTEVVGKVSGTAAGFIKMAVFKGDNAGACTQLGTDQSRAAAGAGDLTVTGLTEVIAANEFIYVAFWVDAGDTDRRVYGIQYKKDRV